MVHSAQQQRRALIVEDDMLLAMNLQDMLEELDYRITAIATRITQALAFASDGEFDFAILDVNLAGTFSFPVADILRQRSIPFIFATGYGIEGLTEEYRNEFVLVKPYGLRELQVAMNALRLSNVRDIPDPVE